MTIPKMKQRLSLMLVLLLMGSFLFPTAGNAADELTAQQKYDALKEKGIFAGLADGTAGLDQNMNRAQFARVAALILDLDGIGLPDTKVVTEAPFSDVKLTHWAVEEITAVKEEGLFQGYPNGTFNPGGEVTVQQLAVVAAGILGIEPVEGAEVEGAADWAAGYIKALEDAGVAFPTNYTSAALRSDLVSLAYVADAQINPVIPEVDVNEAEEEEAEETETPQPRPVIDWPYTPPANPALAIAGVKQYGSELLQVTFNKNIDPETIQLTVTRDGQPVDFQAVPDQANGYLLTLAENVPEGTTYSYTVTASYTDSSTVIGSREVDAYPERIVKLKFGNGSDMIAQGERIGVLVKAYNQFGETMDNPSGLVVYSGNVDATFDSNRMIAIVDVPARGSLVHLAAVHPAAGVSVSSQFTIGTAQIASKLEFRSSLRDTNGQEVAEAQWMNTYHMNIDVLDQYGHMMLYPLPSGTGAVQSTITPNLTNVSIGALSEAPANEPGTLSLPITFGQSGPEEGQAYTFTLYVGAGSANQTIDVADSPVQTLATPTADPAGGEVVSGTPVSLSAASGATIYYTTDGSTPSRTNGFAYTGPFVVNSAMTIKAIAVQDGMQDSDILVESYTINVQGTALNRINVAAESGDWDNVDESTFTDAGVEDVTTSNLAAVIAALKADGATSWTVSDIQTLVNAVIDDLQKQQAALDLINESAESGDWTSVTETTFADAGITGVTTSNVTAVKDALDADGTTSWTLTAIQTIVNAVIDDLQKQQAALDLINVAAESGDWNNVDETTFATAGVEGVTTSNVTAVIAALKADGATSWTVSDIQTIVNAVIDDSARQAALDLINAASASVPPNWSGVTVQTFTDAGITGVTLDLLDDIQISLEQSLAPYPRSASDIQAIFDAVIPDAMVYAIIQWLGFGYGDTPTVDVFIRAGIDGVQAGNIGNILAALQAAYPGSTPFDPPNIQTREDIQEEVDFYLSQPE